MKSRQLIVCPTSAEFTLAVAGARWEGLPKGMTTRFLDRRERSIHDFRRAGRTIAAERFGWLTIARLWVGLGVSDALKSHPAETFDFKGTLVAPPDNPAERTKVTIPNTGLEVADPRDPFGMWLVDLAADVNGRGVVRVNGKPLASAIVADALVSVLRTSS